MIAGAFLPAAPLPVSEVAARLLSALHPPTSVIHVGAGAGAGAAHHWRQLEVPHALFVDQAGSQWLNAAVEEHPGWHFCAAVVAASAIEVTWHQNSHVAESGLLHADALRPVWPHLATVASMPRQATTLDALAARFLPMWHATSGGNWLVVDCFPGLDILQGALQTLSCCSVVWLRVITGREPERASIGATQQLLEAQNFKRVLAVEGLNPAVGEAIFVRDWSVSRIELARLLAAERSMTQAYDGALADMAELRKAYDEGAHARNVAVAQAAALAGEKRALQEQLAETVEQRTTVEQLRNENTALQAEVEALKHNIASELESRLRDEEERQLALTERNAILQENAELLTARQEATRTLAEQQAAVARWQKETAMLQQRLQELEADAYQQSYRQQLQHDELVKAEAQIGLIKDLLLRDAGL